MFIDTNNIINYTCKCGSLVYTNQQHSCTWNTSVGTYPTGANATINIVTQGIENKIDTSNLYLSELKFKLNELINIFKGD